MHSVGNFMHSEQASKEAGTTTFIASCGIYCLEKRMDGLVAWIFGRREGGKRDVTWGGKCGMRTWA